jgi:Xaa-Pro dipeptidase
MLKNEVFELAFELFGIRTYWHKRIVRVGKNTLFPYRENPPDLVLKEDDILFFDFGPVFEKWEADVGKTYVIGNDATKLKLQRDVELAWYQGKAFYKKYRDEITGAELYQYTKNMANEFGWTYGNEHCGHLIGNFPHEKLLGEERINYIHPNNHQPMAAQDQNGNERFWIYEIHLVDETQEIGGFFEQLLS